MTKASSAAVSTEQEGGKDPNIKHKSTNHVTTPSIMPRSADPFPEFHLPNPK